MKKKILLLLVCIQWINATILLNDEQAYDYCRAEPHAFVAILWPITQEKSDPKKKHGIDTLLNRYGTVMYQKKYHFTPLSAYKMLKEAHPHIPSAQPHCSSIKEHLAWYFKKETYQYPAYIYVIYFEHSGDAIACKHAIRNLFPKLQYRSIHINDYHDETISLAKFFFKK